MGVRGNPQIDPALGILAVEKFARHAFNVFGKETIQTVEGRSVGQHDPVFGSFAFRSFDELAEPLALFSKVVVRIDVERVMSRTVDGVFVFAGFQDDDESVSVTEGIVTLAEIGIVFAGFLTAEFMVAANEKDRFVIFVRREFIVERREILSPEIGEVF